MNAFYASFLNFDTNILQAAVFLGICLGIFTPWWHCHFLQGGWKLRTEKGLNVLKNEVGENLYHPTVMPRKVSFFLVIHFFFSSKVFLFLCSTLLVLRPESQNIALGLFGIVALGHFLYVKSSLKRNFGEGKLIRAEPFLTAEVTTENPHGKSGTKSSYHFYRFQHEGQDYKIKSKGAIEGRLGTDEKGEWLLLGDDEFLGSASLDNFPIYGTFHTRGEVSVSWSPANWLLPLVRVLVLTLCTQNYLWCLLPAAAGLTHFIWSDVFYSSRLKKKKIDSEEGLEELDNQKVSAIHSIDLYSKLPDLKQN